MAVTLTLVCDANGWQSAQLHLSTQGIDDPQHVFQSYGGLACLEVDNEAHAHPCRESQLGLCEPELLARSTKGFAELLSGSYGCHDLPSFPFGKLFAGICLDTSDISRSGSLRSTGASSAHGFTDRETQDSVLTTATHRATVRISVVYAIKGEPHA
jgi:hypothetical protein